MDPQAAPDAAGGQRRARRRLRPLLETRMREEKAGDPEGDERQAVTTGTPVIPKGKEKGQ